MRQGSVAFLLDSNQTSRNWCDMPILDLVPRTGGDAEARVSVWVRNNSADALGPNGTASWVDDNDGRVVITEFPASPSPRSRSTALDRGGTRRHWTNVRSTASVGTSKPVTATNVGFDGTAPAPV